MDEDALIVAARKHLEISRRFGRQARQEISADEVTGICELLLEHAEAVQDLQDCIYDLTMANKELKQQRDSANGKLSALQRKQK